MRKLTGLSTFLAFFLAVLFFSRPAQCSGPMTLQDAYRMALSSHETIKAAVEVESQAGYNVDKATSRVLPTLLAEGSYTGYTEQQKTSGNVLVQPDTASSLTLRLTQPIYSGGRDWALKRQAKDLLQKAREGVDLTKENLIRASARAYYGVLKAGKDLEIKKAARDRASERGRVAAARFKVGEVTRSAVLRAEAETAGAEAELKKAEGALTDAKDVLRRLTGASADFTVAEPPARQTTAASADDLLVMALVSRKDYRQSLLDEKAFEEGVRSAKGVYMPSLRAEGLYVVREQSPQTSFFQKDSVSGSLILSYPLFEGGLRRAELAEANSRFREAELRRLSLRRDIEVQVREAVNRAATVAGLVEFYRKQTAFAEEDYRMVFEQFKFGVATTLDVIDADTVLISAQRSLMNSLYDLELADIDIKYVAGALLGEVNSNGQGDVR